jgi:hypothetical protein
MTGPLVGDDDVRVPGISHLRATALSIHNRVVRSRPRGFRCFSGNRDDKDHRSACIKSGSGLRRGQIQLLARAFQAYLGETVRACVYRVRIFGS